MFYDMTKYQIKFYLHTIILMIKKNFIKHNKIYKIIENRDELMQISVDATK